MTAVYFEDISVGQEGVSLRRTVTETDVMKFCGLSGDFNPLHCDQVFSEEVGPLSPFGRRIAHGLLITSIQTSLRSELDDWVLLAYVHEHRRFLKPTFFGDTIQTRWKVTEIKRSGSHPERGIVKLAVEVVNQDGEVVQSGTDTMMIAARDAGTTGEIGATAR